MRYATKNPKSYVHANLDGHVNILETVKMQDPMPARPLPLTMPLCLR